MPVTQNEWRRFVAMLTDEEVNQLRTAIDETINERVVVRDIWKQANDEGLPPLKE